MCNTHAGLKNELGGIEEMQLTIKNVRRSVQTSSRIGLGKLAQCNYLREGEQI